MGQMQEPLKEKSAGNSDISNNTAHLQAKEIPIMPVYSSMQVVQGRPYRESILRTHGRTTHGEFFACSISAPDKPENEDMVLILNSPSKTAHLLVADGFTSDHYNAIGILLSEIAEKILVNNLSAGNTVDTVYTEVLNSWTDAIQELKNNLSYETNQWGQVVAHVEINGDLATISHCGDARVCLIRNGNISHLTLDHNIPGDLVRKGELQYEHLFSHPIRHQVTRSIRIENGVAQEFQFDSVVELLEIGDLLIIASDGITDMVKEHEMMEIFRSLQNETNQLEHFVKSVIRLALSPTDSRRRKEDDKSIIVYRHTGSSL